MPLDLSLVQVVLLLPVGVLTLLCIAAVLCSGRGEELDAALAAAPPEPVGDVFELSDADVDDEFAAIVAQLRREADQRICEAHERNMSELPEIDGSTT